MEDQLRASDADEGLTLKAKAEDLIKRLEHFKAMVEERRGTYYEDQDANDLISRAERLIRSL